MTLTRNLLALVVVAPALASTALGVHHVAGVAMEGTALLSDETGECLIELRLVGQLMPDPTYSDDWWWFEIVGSTNGFCDLGDVFVHGASGAMDSQVGGCLTEGPFHGRLCLSNPRDLGLHKTWYDVDYSKSADGCAVDACYRGLATMTVV